jgi:hypothetical protein
MDDQFPTGPWRVFYTDPRERGHQRMDHLTLEFGTGRITGEGRDVVGPFVVDGRYELSGDCRLTKSYVGQHDVFYFGRKQGKAIVGVWELDGLRGGFRVWPLGHGAGEDESVGEELAEPVEAVGAVVVTGAHDGRD